MTEESIALFGEHLSNEALASITSELQSVVSADGVADEEQNFVDALVQAWQVN